MDDAPAVPQFEHEGLPSDAASTTSANYLSCRFIERGLVFQPSRNISPCCLNSARPGHPVLTAFDGSASALDAALEARAGIIARHKVGVIEPPCQGCPRLEKANWADAMTPYAVDEITITPFSSCNIRCNYCYTMVKGPWTSSPAKAPRMLPMFQPLIDRKLLDPNATVRFSGGEPTLSPEFDVLLQTLTEYGARCVVYTNATKRSEAIMDALRRDKVELVLGIDAASIVVYKAIKKMNYFDKVWKTVADYCGAVRPDAVNKVWAKFIFCAENYHEAEPFVQRADAAGAKYVYYNVDVSRSPGRLRQGLGALPEVITDYIAVLRHECAMRGIEAQFSQFGLAWLTPERTERIEGELARLDQADLTAARASEQTVVAKPAVRATATKDCGLVCSDICGHTRSEPEQARSKK